MILNAAIYNVLFSVSSVRNFPGLKNPPYNGMKLPSWKRNWGPHASKGYHLR
jgi:hypothetical protein